MPTYRPSLALGPDGSPGEWGEAVPLAWTQRDALLYAVGIGIRNLQFIWEGHKEFAVFPTFPIIFGGAGAPVSHEAVPPSPGPLNINAEQYLEVLRPLPPAGKGSVQERIIGVHPRGKGSGFIETESVVNDSEGNQCVRIVGGSFRRGVKRLGDIEPFEGMGATFSEKLAVPDRAPDIVCERRIPDNQAHIFRLSGDYNPLHIDPESAKFGGFDEPILHGMCTFGFCAQMLLEGLCGGDPSCFRRIKVRFSAPVFLEDHLRVRAWRDGPGRVLFEADVGGKAVVTNAYFEFDGAPAPLAVAKL